MNYFIDDKSVSVEEFNHKVNELALLFDNVVVWFVPSKGNYIILEEYLKEKMGAKK